MYIDKSRIMWQCIWICRFLIANRDAHNTISNTTAPTQKRRVLRGQQEPINRYRIGGIGVSMDIQIHHFAFAVIVTSRKPKGLFYIPTVRNKWFVRDRLRAVQGLNAQRSDIKTYSTMVVNWQPEYNIDGRARKIFTSNSIVWATKVNRFQQAMG